MNNKQGTICHHLQNTRRSYLLFYNNNILQVCHQPQTNTNYYQDYCQLRLSLSKPVAPPPLGALVEPQHADAEEKEEGQEAQENQGALKGPQLVPGTGSPKFLGCLLEEVLVCHHLCDSHAQALQLRLEEVALDKNI